MKWVLFNYSCLWSPNLIFGVFYLLCPHPRTLSSEVVIYLDLLSVDVYQSSWYVYQSSFYFSVFELYVKSGAWKI